MVSAACRRDRAAEVPSASLLLWPPRLPSQLLCEILDNAEWREASADARLSTHKVKVL
jgi:hypothetical protein